MKKFAKVLFCPIFCTCLAFPLLPPKISFAMPITMNFDGADAKEALFTIAREGHLDIVVDTSVDGSLSLSLKDVEPEEAIALIARTKGLVVEKNGKVLLLRKATGNEGLYRVHVFHAAYGAPEDLARAIKLSLGTKVEAGNITSTEKKKDGTKEGSDVGTETRIHVDPVTNALLLYGTDSEAKKAEEILKALDVPAKQISLEAKVVAIEKSAARALGIDWTWSPFPEYPYVSEAKGNSGNVASYPQREAGGVVSFGRGPNGHPYEFYYQAKLNALSHEGKANVLSRPNIVTLQGKEATINIGGKVPVPTVSVTNSTTTTSLEYHDAGIILRYTPRANDDGFITAKVHTEVSTPIYVEDMKAYKFQERTADTTVRLKDGETMVIGGLIGSEETRSLAKIPFLGDLPILGNFFKSVKRGKSDTELLIFLTAHVLP